MKNKYFIAIEKIAKEMDLPCSKHHPHSWFSPHRQERYVTFYHKVLFIRFDVKGRYYFDAGCDFEWEEFNELFRQMRSFIRKYKREVINK